MGRNDCRHITVVLVAILVFVVQGCATTTDPGSVTAKKSNQTTVESRAADAFDGAQWAILAKGVALIEHKQPEQAIKTSFDPVIAAYAAHYANTGFTIYSALTREESLLYVVNEAAEHDAGRTRRDAMVVGPAWGYAWFWKGYALGELGDNVAAQAALHEALRLSPNNPHFLSELGYTYIREKRWIEALSTYESADAFALFAMEESRKDERGRAWRGQGYALVELGRYDEAEAKYRACLKLDPKDEKARGELGYVLEQKAKAKANKL